MAKDINKQLALAAKLSEQAKKNGEQSLEYLEAQANYHKLNVEFYSEQNELETIHLDNLDKANEAYEEGLKLVQKAEGATSAVEAATTSLLKRTALVNETWRTGIIGALLDSEDKLGDITKALKKQVTVSNLLGTQFRNMAEMSLKMFHSSDAAAASILKVTGGAGIGQKAIGSLVKANMHLGVTFDDLSGSFIAMHSDFTNFHSLSKTQRNDLAVHAAKLEQFGISASTTAQNMQDLTMIFKMTPDLARATTTEFAQLAIALDMPVEALTQNFRDQMPVLSKWGKQGIPMFKKMQIQARKLGVQLGTLSSMGDQFDTFEGASSAVSKLNALVGGDVLNTYEMMNMNLNERNEAVKRAVELDSESWGSMDRMKQMAYANAAGISDMGEAHKLFGGASADSLSAEEKRVSQQVKSQKSLESTMVNTVTALDRIQNLLTNLFDSPMMREALGKMEELLTYAVNNSDKIRSAFPWLVGGVGAMQLGGGLAGGALGTLMAKGGGKLVSGGLGMLLKNPYVLGTLAAAAVAGMGYLWYKNRGNGDGAPSSTPVSSGASSGVRKASGARSSTGNSETDRLAAALTVAINNAQGHDVVLKIDGNEIGRFTERYLGQKYKVR